MHQRHHPGDQLPVGNADSNDSHTKYNSDANTNSDGFTDGASDAGTHADGRSHTDDTCSDSVTHPDSHTYTDSGGLA